MPVRPVTAMPPISMTLSTLYGSVPAGVARGLTLRMDHGPQYLSGHFLNLVKFWGIKPSFAFIAEPQTNGVAERFNRTLKEQAIYGLVFRTVEDVRQAVRNVVGLYNSQWGVEKNGFKRPMKIPQDWLENRLAAQNKFVSKKPDAVYPYEKSSKIVAPFRMTRQCSSCCIWR